MIHLLIPFVMMISFVTSFKTEQLKNARVKEAYNEKQLYLETNGRHKFK